MKVRNIRHELEEALTDSPAVLLHGARQTGKTTLARQIAEGSTPKRRYLTFDNAAVLAAAHTNPHDFIEGLQGNVVLDEIQRAPGLFPAIKMAIDQNRQPGRFLMTGSANVLALPKLSESLAGRMEIVPLWPFSMGETMSQKEDFIGQLFSKEPFPHLTYDQKDLWPHILAGGYPEALHRTNAKRRHSWFSSYITTILQRDVREISNIEGLQSFPRILELLATRIGGLLNMADLANSLKMPANTLKRYIALLQATFLVRVLPAWSSNLGLRLIKSPKLFLVDTGLVSGVLSLDEARLKRESTLKGLLLENFVVMELTKQASWSAVPSQLFHFRTHSGEEVDIVLEARAGMIAGIEVKSGSSVRPEDLKGLKKLREMAGKRFQCGIILYTGQEVIGFDKNLYAVPISTLWAMGRE